ncbi:MAG: glycosyltransferase family 9 protein, partial [Limisphaerales bacterium]
MRLLFLKTKNIGDALLMTPALTAVREQYPRAEIWVVVRASCEGILAGCPAIDRLLTTAEPETDRRGPGAFRRDLALVRELRRARFDMAFELGDCDRGRWLAWLSGARVRCGARRYVRLGPVARRLLNRWSDVDWVWCHRAEKDFHVVGAGLPLRAEAPPLAFVRERAQHWPGAPLDDSFAVLHPVARWPVKRWPAERWATVGRHLLGRVGRLVVSSGPDAEERALNAELVRSLGPRAVSTDGTASWAELAGLLWRARLFVGVDTAAMHLAAA